MMIIMIITIKLMEMMMTMGLAMTMMMKKRRKRITMMTMKTRTSGDVGTLRHMIINALSCCASSIDYVLLFVSGTFPLAIV